MPISIHPSVDGGVKKGVADFGGGRLLLRDDAGQFQDEPVETWFGGRFAGTPDRLGRIADLLAPQSGG